MIGQVRKLSASVELSLLYSTVKTRIWLRFGEQSTTYVRTSQPNKCKKCSYIKNGYQLD